MTRFKRFRPSPATAIAVTALVVGAGGVAFATIPDSGGTIHACYQQRNGDLRVVESASECRNQERPLQWSSGTGGTDGTVQAKSGRLPYGQETVLFDFPGFVRATLRCFDGPADVEAIVTLENQRTVGEVQAWVAPEGANATRQQVAAGASQSFTITEQGWILHVSGEPTSSTFGPVHLDNTGSDCLFASQATGNS
jgi:hypothetical protein